MKNPFLLPDDKLKTLLASYSSWLNSDIGQKEEDYHERQKEITRGLKRTLLNKKYLSRVSKKDLAQRIFDYSRNLEGPVYIRLGMPRISGNANKIKRRLHYLIESPDSPFIKAMAILEGRYRIPIFARAFWTPIFLAQYPKVLPNWNNKTERFLREVGINLRSSKFSTEEKYQQLSEAFLYLQQIDPKQDFYTLNHLMHYGTEIPEGKELMKELRKEKLEDGKEKGQGISYWRVIEPLDTKPYVLWPGCREKELIAIGFANYPSAPDIKNMRDRMEIGDKVVAYLESGRVGGIGTVVGEYKDYSGEKPKEKDYFGGDFWRRRKVHWNYLPQDSGYWQLPPPYSKNIPGMRQTVFKLTKDQFDKILKMIGLKRKDQKPEDGSRIISKEAILKEIFLKEEKFGQIIDLLESSKKKQVILQGPPGTGKTFIAGKIARYLTQSEERIETIQFHSSYSYEDFIEGYRPSENRGFELTAGIFKSFCHQAKSNPDKSYVLVIDEINRGNLSKIFGELLYLLEYRDQTAKLTYSQELFSIPQNLYIIGTMNTADRSLAIMDYALRRRFYFVSLSCQTRRLGEWLKEHGCRMRVGDLIEKIKRMNQRISEEMRSSDFVIGHSYFMKEDLDGEKLKEIIEFEIKPLLEEYFFDKKESVAEILGLIKVEKNEK